MPLPGDFADLDFDDGGVGESHGVVGDGLDAGRHFVAVVEHDAVKPCGAFLRIFNQRGCSKSDDAFVEACPFAGVFWSVGTARLDGSFRAKTHLWIYLDGVEFLAFAD